MLDVALNKERHSGTPLTDGFPYVPISKPSVTINKDPTIVPYYLIFYIKSYLYNVMNYQQLYDGFKHQHADVCFEL